LAAAGCKQGLGDRCQVSDDCGTDDSGVQLICQFRTSTPDPAVGGTCQSGTAPMTDMATGDIAMTPADMTGEDMATAAADLSMADMATPPADMTGLPDLSGDAAD